MAFKVVHHTNEAAENDSMRKIVTAATTMLRHASPLAREIIDFLEARTPSVTIVVKNEPDPGFNCWKPGDANLDGGSGKVYWCSARPKQAGQPSAELGLIHELGHEYQLHTDRQKVLQSIESSGRVKVDQRKYISDFEDTVVLAIERPVAHDINNFLTNTLRIDPKSHLLEPIRDAYIRKNLFGAIVGPAPFIKQHEKPSKIEKNPRKWT
jgi:hypothetical protein